MPGQHYEKARKCGNYARLVPARPCTSWLHGCEVNIHPQTPKHLARLKPDEICLEISLAPKIPPTLIGLEWDHGREIGGA